MISTERYNRNSRPAKCLAVVAACALAAFLGFASLAAGQAPQTQGARLQDSQSQDTRRGRPATKRLNAINSPELIPPATATVNRPKPAEKKPAVPLHVALERRGDLTLRNSSLNAALFTISELWGINIVAGDVPGSVNGVFVDAPLREILDSILISNGYGYRSVGESLVVSNLSQLGQVNPYFISATIPITAASVQEVVSGASLLSTPQGQIKAIPSANSLFVLDFPDRVKMIREFAKSVDDAARIAAGGGPIGLGPQPLEVAYLKPQFVSAEAARAALEAVASPVGRIAVMNDEERILAVDYAENLRMMQTVMQSVDRPRPQVSIRALIYDISLQDMEEIGLNWHSLANGDMNATFSAGGSVNGTGDIGPAATGLLANSVTKTPFADSTTGSAFTFFTLNENFSLAAVALALQGAADSRLLADPNVTVVDNDEATIQSVSEIPFQQLTQTAAGGNIGTTAFKEAGITLNVKPRIARDGTIEMDVRPEFSRLTGFTPGDNQPIIDRRTAETRVRVSNGQTFVIGGLRQRTDVGDFKGIPFLKDVRVLGHLFRARETDIRESELVVFITPTIVGFEGHNTPREQCIADTVNCRLAQIPGAEGCPNGYGCNGGAYCGRANCADLQSDEPTVAERKVSPKLGEMNPDETRVPVPYRDDTTPISAETVSSTGCRRLPPVDSGEPPAMSGRRDSGEPARARVGSRMRPDYDSRYRADKDIQRVSQRPSEGSETTPEGQTRTPLWKRAFLR